VLGGGYDTLLWRLRDIGVNVSRWFDVDLPHVVERKGSTIRSYEMFAPLDRYSLLAINLGEPGALEAGLKANSFDVNLPTVFIDECTLIYVDPDSVDAIIRFAASLKSSGFISYGMIKPDDRFGALMVQNFQNIGAPLRGIAKYPTVESHQKRFTTAGYTKVKAVDMNGAMKAVLTYEEQCRVRRLEMQDDPDELAFMLAHYVLAIASTDDEFVAILK
jgi:[phosphatase 2A protein]-leucine-carboxy methyltransferase